VRELAGVEGIGFKTAERIARVRNDFNVDAELELAEKLGVWIVNIDDDRYPTVLRKIYDPPPVLYVKGSLSKKDNVGIAIVGSRRCSLYGKEQASRFSHLLGSSGFSIVSGMARGIDTAAHQSALSAGGRTIAVQGCGLGKIFPPENDKLFGMISQSGACISELPLEYEPLSENFPARNRIIAGMTLGTIVIEAGLRSGSLITARLAMENGREVMAVPGKIDSPLSQGSHLLIKQGARLIDSVEDVIEALGCIGKQIETEVVSATKKRTAEVELPLFDVNMLKLTAAERLIYDCLSQEEMQLDEIIEETKKEFLESGVPTNKTKMVGK